MAKKKRSRKGDFNMAAEVRNILTDNPELVGKEALAELKKKFPRRSINENSFGVAFSGARRELGISKPRKVRRRKPAAKRSRRAGTAAVDLTTLQSARKYLSEVGDVDSAIAAIKQVQTLQLDR